MTDDGRAGDNPANPVTSALPAHAALPELPALAATPALPELAEITADDPDPGRHPSRTMLSELMAGNLRQSETRDVLMHMLHGCPSCAELAREAWNLPTSATPASLSTPAPPALSAPPPPSTTPPHPPHPPTPPTIAVGAPAHAAAPETAARIAAGLTAAPAAPLAAAPAEGDHAAHVSHASHPANAVHAANTANTAYDAVLDRVFARVTQQEAAIEAERRRAEALLAELMQHPPARQSLLIHNSVRFRGPMLCESLIAAGHEMGFRDPARSQHLARLAVEVAERDAARSGSPAATTQTAALAAGLRARAWAQLANAKRLGADLEGAARTFALTDAILAAEPAISPLDQARILDLKASLARDRRDMPQALRLLERAISIYRRLGQTGMLGNALSQKALVLLEAGDHKASMPLLRRALDLLDPNEDPRRYLSARHNLICALLADGRPRDAFALLFHTRPLYLKVARRAMLVRMRWVEGQIAHALHRVDQAEAAYVEVREGFVEMGDAYDAALVSLDLASLYAQQGRAAEVRRLAQEMLTFFESRQIHREAMAALLVFCKAARMEQAGLGLVQEVAAFLKRARAVPDLVFSPKNS